MALKLHRVENRFDGWKVELDLDPADVQRCFSYSQQEYERDRRNGFSAEFTQTIMRFREMHKRQNREKVLARLIPNVVGLFGQDFLDENPFEFDDLSFTEL